MMRIISFFPNFLTNSVFFFNLFYLLHNNYYKQYNVFVWGNHGVVQTLHKEISNLRGGFLPSILAMVSTSKVLHAYVKLSLLTHTWTYKDLVYVNNPSLTRYPVQGILSHHSIAWCWNFQASLSGRGPGSFLCLGYVGGAELNRW